MSNLPLNIDFTQIFLHLLNFLILFAVLYFLLYKPVKKYMDNRQASYSSMDEEARGNLKTAEETRAQYEACMSEAESEISNMKKAARAETERVREAQLDAAREEAERIIREAKEEATREKEKIIAEAQSEIAEMITDATEKLILKATDQEAFDQFLSAVELAEESGSRHDN